MTKGPNITALPLVVLRSEVARCAAVGGALPSADFLAFRPLTFSFLGPHRRQSRSGSRLQLNRLITGGLTMLNDVRFCCGPEIRLAFLEKTLQSSSQASKGIRLSRGLPGSLLMRLHVVPKGCVVRSNTTGRSLGSRTRMSAGIPARRGYSARRISRVPDLANITRPLGSDDGTSSLSAGSIPVAALMTRGNPGNETSSGGHGGR
jgi:hypothetical protein